MDIYAGALHDYAFAGICGWLRKAIQALRLAPTLGPAAAWWRLRREVIGRAEALPYLRSKNNGKNNSNNGCVG